LSHSHIDRSQGMRLTEYIAPGLAVLLALVLGWLVISGASRRVRRDTPPPVPTQAVLEKLGRQPGAQPHTPLRTPDR
jgi:hypothetical protein